MLFVAIRSSPAPTYSTPLYSRETKVFCFRGSMVACQPVGELVVAIHLCTIPLTGYVEGMVTEKLLDFMDRKAGTPTFQMLLPPRNRVSLSVT